MNNRQTLRHLKRHYQAIRNLRRDVSHHIMNYQLFDGMDKMLTKTYTALHTNISQAVDDPVLDAYALEIDGNLSSKQVATQVLILSGQLLAYVEGTIDYLEEVIERNQKGKSASQQAEETIERFSEMMDEDSE